VFLTDEQVPRFYFSVPPMIREKPFEVTDTNNTNTNTNTNTTTTTTTTTTKIQTLIEEMINK
jgi:hypothetical protein